MNKRKKKTGLSEMFEAIEKSISLINTAMVQKRLKILEEKVGIAPGFKPGGIVGTGIPGARTCNEYLVKSKTMSRIIRQIYDCNSQQPRYYSVGDHERINKIILTTRQCYNHAGVFDRPCYIGYNKDRNEMFQCWADTMNVIYTTP